MNPKVESISQYRNTVERADRRAAERAETMLAPEPDFPGDFREDHK